MVWHGYFAVEDINLSVGQRATLITALRGLSHPTNPRFPAKILTARLSLNGKKGIFEAEFDEGELTVNSFKQRLASIFEIDSGEIDNDNSTTTFANRQSNIVMFSYAGDDKLRVALFGGTGSNWEQSRTEVVAYLSANIGEWDE